MNMSGNIAIYPGTFDPVTRGHLDIIERGLKIFDGLIVAIAGSTSKTTLFNVEERLAMLSEATEPFERVKVDSFETLLIDYARTKGVHTTLRGLRVMSDFEYEFQMALTNRKLAPDIETVFMMTSEGYASVSSRFIKEIARLGGDVSNFVTPNVEARLKERYGI